jgi:alkylation response protein AidB-like acyl-CoA dehydrogenase
MDFNLSEESELLKRSAAKFLQEKCPSSLLRDLIKDEDGFSRSVWKEMIELGWLGLIYDEKYGGIGGRFFDLFILFEEIGKVLLPSPFFCSAVLAGLAINEAGDEDQKGSLLPSIIEGEKIFTLALLDEQGKDDAGDPNIEAVRTEDNGYLISGTRLLVPYAHIADGIILCARVKDGENGGPTLFLIDGKASGQHKTLLDTMTEEKTFAVTYEKLKTPAQSILGEIGKGKIYLDNILPRATVLKCGEMLGGLERVVNMTIGYMKERNQFGRPLGTLQAVQHFCADMATYLETTRLLTCQAAYLLSEGLECDKEIAMAKAWCNEAYRKSTWIAQQLHGGIGFTEEYDLHFYYKHAKASELAFEGSWFHRSRVAESMGL